LGLASGVWSKVSDIVIKTHSISVLAKMVRSFMRNNSTGVVLKISNRNVEAATDVGEQNGEKRERSLPTDGC